MDIIKGIKGFQGYMGIIKDIKGFGFRDQGLMFLIRV